MILLDSINICEASRNTYLTIGTQTATLACKLKFNLKLKALDSKYYQVAARTWGAKQLARSIAGQKKQEGGIRKA